MLFGEADEHLLPDLLHPNGEGYELMGQYVTHVLHLIRLLAFCHLGKARGSADLDTGIP
eukprot:COSAG02_NODE_9379_length_2237_cov_1.377456_2_plen_59_part_00